MLYSPLDVPFYHKSHAIFQTNEHSRRQRYRGIKRQVSRWEQRKTRTRGSEGVEFERRRVASFLRRGGQRETEDALALIGDDRVSRRSEVSELRRASVCFYVATGDTPPWNTRLAVDHPRAPLFHLVCKSARRITRTIRTRSQRMNILLFRYL